MCQHFPPTALPGGRLNARRPDRRQPPLEHRYRPPKWSLTAATHCLTVLRRASCRSRIVQTATVGPSTVRACLATKAGPFPPLQPFVASRVPFLVHRLLLTTITLRATVDRPPRLEPPSNWYSSHYSGQPAPPDYRLVHVPMSSYTDTERCRAHRHHQHRKSRPQGPSENGVHPVRNDKFSVADKNFDPPRQPKGMVAERNKG